MYHDNDILPDSVWLRAHFMIGTNVRRWTLRDAIPVTLPIRKRGRQHRRKRARTATAPRRLPRTPIKRLLLGLFTFWLIFPERAASERKRFRPEAYVSTRVTDDDCQEAIARCYKATTQSRGSLVDFTSGHSQKVYLDNCANTHIGNCKEDFISYRDLSSSSENEGVGNVGGTAKPMGIGTVRWKWEDDLGKEHTYELKDCRYFPNSPANILSISSLGIQLQDDDDGTWIKSGPYTSTFTWEKGKYSKTIKHTASQMPMMHINGSNSKIGIFYSSFKTLYDESQKFSFLTDAETIQLQRLEIAQLLAGTQVLVTHPDGRRERGTILQRDGDVGYKVQLDSGQETTYNPMDLELHQPGPTSDVTKPPQELFQEILSHGTDHTMQRANEPLSEDQKELLHWHYRLGHLPFTQLLRLAQYNVIPKKLSKLKTLPLCPACILGQQRKRAWRSKGQPDTIRRAEHLKPGALVHVDQLVSGQLGFIPQVTGALTAERIVGATVFVDSYSNFRYVHLMRRLDTIETLEAKTNFERLLDTYGVKVQAYRADNGRFADLGFMEACKDAHQEITFCGVGAHHQNGVAERAIGDLTSTARTFLVTGMYIWPKMVTKMLWPSALLHACDRHNNLNFDAAGYTPHHKLSGQHGNIDVSTYHPWGCPAYVLQDTLQSGTGKAPKWDPRARLGVYLGYSPFHSRKVALVLNPYTGHVSPQYHVTFDDDFTTLPFVRQGTEPPHWTTLFDQSTYKATDTPFEATEHWTSPNFQPTHVNQHCPRVPIAEPSLVPEGEKSDEAAKEPSNASTLIPVPLSQGTEKETLPSTPSNPASMAVSPSSKSDMPPMINIQEGGLRRSTRQRVATKFFGFITYLCFSSCAGEYVQKQIEGDGRAYSTQQVLARDELLERNVDGSRNFINPISQCFASLAENETYNFAEALKQEDSADFVLAMLKEINDHETKGHWIYRKRAEVKNLSTIMAIWSFKRKRAPDGTLIKHKARLCAHGGQQRWGVNYWETYSPVVNWMSVRLMLIISIIHDLPVRSVDFVLAFPQADLDVPVFMELPAGMEIEDARPGEYVIELKKSLYGLKQSGLNWFEKLKKGLEDRGFQSSQIDPCVFISKNTICLVYVDDCIMISKDNDNINRLISNLLSGAENFELTDDGNLQNYIGVEFTKHTNGMLEMKQEFLIKRIMEALNLPDMSSTAVPSIKPSLFADDDGPPRRQKWHYRSVIGMLNYLEKTTRPDLAFAVHQAARFSINPKLSHERAIHRIVKYLVGTKDKGLLFRPNKSLGIVCHVDADFAGLWNKIDAEKPTSVLSRTGYVIQYCGCPLVWMSKL